jgi:ferric enterobactin receptor
LHIRSQYLKATVAITQRKVYTSAYVRDGIGEIEPVKARVGIVNIIIQCIRGCIGERVAYDQAVIFTLFYLHSGSDHRNGISIGAFTGNLAGYTFQKNAKGELLIDPATGYPINQNSFENIADRQPDFKIGIINSFNYKGFNLNFNIDIRKGGDVFNANEMYLYTNGLSTRTLNRETPRVIKGILKDGLENTDNPTPNGIAVTPYYTQGYYNASTSEADFIEDVNWLRMRDISLSYRFPDALIKRIRVIKNMTVSVSAQDLFIITNYTGADPNVNSLNATSRGFGGAGIDYGTISNPRRFNFGLRFQL